MFETAKTAVAVIGIDIGKNSFHVVGLDRRGAIVLRQKWSRGQVETRLANMSPCLIGMEACVGAHHLSRRLKPLGHDARLMPAKYVRPYSKGQKNDFRVQIELIGSLRRHELYRRPLHRFSDRFSVTEVILLALGIGPHILRRHQPSVVAKRLKSTTEMMRPDAGLHANQTGRHIGKPGLNLVT